MGSHSHQSQTKQPIGESNSSSLSTNQKPVASNSDRQEELRSADIINALTSVDYYVTPKDSTEVTIQGDETYDNGNIKWTTTWNGPKGEISEETREERSQFIKEPFNFQKAGATETGERVVLTVQAEADGVVDTQDREFIIRIPTEEIKTWEVLFDNEDLQTATRLEEEPVRPDPPRVERSDPLIFDLDRNGELDTATGSHLADGTIDGRSVNFDIDPSRSSWEFVTSTLLPGEENTPAMPNGKVVYADGSTERIGDNGRWNPNFSKERAKIYNAQDQWVMEWIRLDDDAYDLFWGNRLDQERTEWVKKGAQDGFLVWDHNGNGQIDDNTEMMSEFDVQGRDAFANGYEKLRHYFDKDGDGVIQGNEMKGLMFWVDTNANASTEEGELKTLQEHGIQRIQIPTEGKLTSTSTAKKVEFLPQNLKS
jgi:hypothetical protein